MRRVWWPLVIVLGLASVSAQRIPGFRIVTPPAAQASGVTCADLGITCDFETSFTNAQGWDADKTGRPCGVLPNELQNVQAGISSSEDGSLGGNCATVNAAGNYASGAGGRGYQFFVGDGTNQMSGNMRLAYTAKTHYWLRYYVRYSTNMAVTGNGSPHKSIYHNGGSGCGHASGCYFGWGTTEVRLTNGSPSNNFTNGGVPGGWTTMMGGATSDGNWHLAEYEFDMGNGSSTGIARFWWDGVQYLNRTDVNYGSTAGFDTTALPNNGEWTVTGSGIGTVSFDDIATSVVSRIGGAVP